MKTTSEMNAKIIQPSILKADTDVTVYPDQTNVTVTITMSNDNIYRIQTDENGFHTQQLGCESWLNDNDEFERCDNDEFNLAVAAAEKVAIEKLEELAEKAATI